METGDERSRWSSNLGVELDFWRYWIANKPDEYCRRLSDPKRQLDPYIAQWINAPRWRRVRLLDVGAGPLTALAPRWGRRRLKVAAVDPLAREYNRVLKEHGVRPAIATRHGEAERLTTLFGRDRFDLAFASNCLDHSYDPVGAIREMVAVVRPGCYAVLEHATDEAVANNYEGLHQWNFNRDDDGRFVVWRPETRIAIQEALAEMATVECEVRDIEGGRQWVSVRIRKVARTTSRRRFGD